MRFIKYDQNQCGYPAHSNEHVINRIGILFSIAPF